jgi:hypothetical protein
MKEALDLREIERKAFRSTHQDGLWDIYIGGIVLCMAFLAQTTSGGMTSFLRFGLYLAGMGLFYLLFWAGKKFLTLPRLGQVKFGPYRARRKRIMVGVLLAIVLVQAIILAGTILLWANPGWAVTLGLSNVGGDIERLLVAGIGAMFVGPSMLFLAYFNDFLRGYYIAVILSLAVFSLVWFGQPGYLVAASFLILVPGLVLFIRFLRAYPLPPAEVRHG